MPQEDMDAVLSRLDRLEAVQAIQQLASRYAVAVDSRDVQAWVNLFIEDVNCGRRGSGRMVLLEVISGMLKTFYRSIHFIGNHKIEFIDSDHATGIVYCRADHEVGSEWIVVPVAYFDEYERRDGKWYFVRRREKHWYSADHLERPPALSHVWPEVLGPARLPGDFPTWTSFWSEVPASELALLTDAPIQDAASGR